MLSDRLIYSSILVFTWPLRWLSYRSIHKIGSFLGACLFYGSSKFRKRALSNLSLASSLHLSKKEVVSFAKRSIQNVMITCLEYPKLSREKNIHHLVQCENPKQVEDLYKTGISPIFFCGHQANWELFFLEGTKRMRGVAIGRPIKNQFLYNWALKIRQKYGGKIIHPREAVREGLKALREGSFLGIVGDQGMPESGLCSSFLGRKAWTSPIPALLSYRTGSPLVVATMKRQKTGYRIRYSEPIWPNRKAPAHQ
jgi:KDO2-lipid IV(A) lauroyltransferase